MHELAESCFENVPQNIILGDLLQKDIGNV